MNVSVSIDTTLSPVNQFVSEFQNTIVLELFLGIIIFLLCVEFIMIAYDYRQMFRLMPLDIFFWFVVFFIIANDYWYKLFPKHVRLSDSIPFLVFLNITVPILFILLLLLLSTIIFMYIESIVISFFLVPCVIIIMLNGSYAGRILLDFAFLPSYSIFKR